MRVSSIFGAMTQAITQAFAGHPPINASVAAVKIAQVQSGLVMAEAVVESLPESPVQKEALAALQSAATIAGKAIVVAHTVEAVEAMANANTNASKSAG